MEKIKIFVTNLGRYNEGVLQGEWVKLPIPGDKLDEVLARIGINSTSEEYFITDYESSMANLEISEYTSISEINALAEQLEELDDWQYEKLCAVVEAESPSSVKAIQAFIQELDSFDLIPEITDETSLGEFYVEACGILLSLSETVQRYFDYTAFGRDIHLQGCGVFTSFGYVEDRR